MAGFEDYEAALEEIFPGEPEAYMSLLHRAIEARARDDMAGVNGVREELEGIAGRHGELTPTLELAPLHRFRAMFLDSLIAAVSAVEARDMPYDLISEKEVMFRLPTRRCFETLLEYYREMLRLLELHQCDEGDIEALRHSYIPRLQRLLADEFTGDRGR
jgi:hypothetical protein